MKIYFYLQLKRILRILPLVATVSLVLLLGLCVILSSVATSFTENDSDEAFTIGITGDTDSSLIDLAVSAFESSQGSSLSLQFSQMSEKEAQNKLSSGDIEAYIILPEDFVDNALLGSLEPVTYVTTPGNTGVIPMLKNELTKVVTDILVYSQKGTYGVGDALISNDHDDLAYEYINEIAIDYATLALSRQETYTIEMLSTTDDATTAEYFMCGLSVLLIMLIGLPYATIYTKKDYSLSKLMVSKGYSNFRQLLCEYLSHLISVVLVIISVILMTALFSFVMPDAVLDFVNIKDIFSFVLSLVPVIFMISAFNIMFFTLSDNIISTMLMHFLTSLCLCYIGGCLYPISTFPVSVQKISSFLPTGAAQNLLLANFGGNSTLLPLFLTLVYTVVFFYISVVARNRKTANKRG